MKIDYELKQRLDTEVIKRDTKSELTLQTPDPLMIAKHENNEYSALICALFSYGNAKLIVKFLNSLDFTLLNKDEKDIKKSLIGYYYRFQKDSDVQALFIALKRLKDKTTIEKLFIKGYKNNHNVLQGIFNIINSIRGIYHYSSFGYNFLIGKANMSSPYKRWLMYLRWMVRSDNLDMGLWKGVNTKDLLLPLDTHTFRVGHKLGLLKRKTYDLKAVFEISSNLKKFDKNDPIKYDFALYRLGQEKQIKNN